MLIGKFWMRFLTIETIRSYVCFRFSSFFKKYPISYGPNFIHYSPIVFQRKKSAGMNGASSSESLNVPPDHQKTCNLIPLSVHKGPVLNLDSEEFPGLPQGVAMTHTTNNNSTLNGWCTKYFFFRALSHKTLHLECHL